jgi:outer membrane protein insertion porin family
MKFLFYSVNKISLFVGICLIFLFWEYAYSQNDSWKIGKVKIEGNKYLSSGTIKNQMMMRDYPWYRRFTMRSESLIYRRVFLLQDIPNIESYYQSIGFIDAKVKNYTVEYDSTKQKVNISLKIEEGSRYKADSINVVFSSENVDSAFVGRVSGLIRLKKSDVLEMDKIKEDIDRIHLELLNTGYPFSSVQTNIFPYSDKKDAMVQFWITPERFVSIDSIKISGLKNINKNIVKKQIEIKPGDIYNQEKINENRVNIYRLDLFQFVNITPDTTALSKSKVNLLVNLLERKSHELQVGAGYNAEEKFKGKLLYNHFNFLGQARKFSINSNVSFIYQNLDFAIQQPSFLLRKGLFGLDAYVRREAELSYTLRNIGIQPIFRNYISNYSYYKLQYRLENNSINFINPMQIDPDVIATKLSDYNKSIVSAQILYDKRDNFLDPKRGYYFQMTTEYSMKLFSAQYKYLKTFGEGRIYFPQKNSSVVGYWFKIGSINEFKDSHFIPVEERFYAGGSSSVRSFGRRLLGPKDSKGNPIGGRYIFEMSTEYRFLLFYPVQSTIFYDVGNVWSEMKYIKLKNLQHALGIGLRIITPVGPARIDIGYRPERVPLKKSHFQLHVSIGQTF